MNKINRDKNGYVRSERVNWLDAFADSLEEKTAVEVARERSQSSIHDQFNSIMNGSKQTVTSKIIDLQKRTGLRAFMEVASPDLGKIASEGIFPDYSENLSSEITQFVRNLVKTYRGYIDVSAVQEEILEHFSNQGIRPDDVNTKAVATFINQVLIEEQKINPNINKSNNQLGKGLGVIDSNGDDPGNSDFMHGLLPVRD